MSTMVATADPKVSRASWLTLIAMTGSLSMVMLDQTVVSVALPTMTRDLPLSASGAQWVVNAYVLAMAAAVALGGRLGSKLGPVTTFRIGVATFFIASALCGLSPSGSWGQDWMIAARVGQGLGAALMMPVTASIVMAAFPERMRGRAMGTYVGISQIFLALGPLLGGTFTQWLSWRAVFWINVPVGLVALFLVAKAAPANPKQSTLKISTSQTVLLMSGIGATVYALQESSDWGWTSGRTLGLLAAGLIVLVGFVLAQLSTPEPLVDVRLFANSAFLGDTVVLFATQFGMLAMTLYASLYSQNLLGYSPTKAGFASLSMIVPLMIGAQIAGRWYDKSGVRPPLLTGMTITIIGAALWTLALPDIAYASKVPGMALVGLGLGLAFSPLNTDALSRVAPSSRPQASGIVQTVRQLGGTLGVAVIGSVILSHENPYAAPASLVHDTAHAMTYGFWIAVGVFTVGLVAGHQLLPKKTKSPLLKTSVTPPPVMGQLDDVASPHKSILTHLHSPQTHNPQEPLVGTTDQRYDRTLRRGRDHRGQCSEHPIVDRRRNVSYPLEGPIPLGAQRPRNAVHVEPDARADARQVVPPLATIPSHTDKGAVSLPDILEVTKSRRVTTD